jgi:3,4-dihydroxy 2-butanone 4-phosphate synthase / GTP cyclohydrolase II
VDPLTGRCEALVRSSCDVRVQARVSLPTRHGHYETLAFAAGDDPTTHLALVRGAVADDDVLVRVHSECLTGETLGSLRCDCGGQLEEALDLIAAAGQGVLVYLRGHEGRGIGLVDKLRAYALQDTGLDTVDANLALGHQVDERSYEPAAAILAHLGVRSVTLMTNNPDKILSLTRHGVRCHRVLPTAPAVNQHNELYLRTKAERLGHRVIGLGLVHDPKYWETM